MFLVYETLLNHYPAIPEQYGDENCCLVTGYPKRYIRQRDFAAVTYEQLYCTRTLLFELHTPLDQPQHVHLIDGRDFYMHRRVSFSFVNRLESKFPYVERPSM
jgi:hypothetical protein